MLENLSKTLFSGAFPEHFPHYGLRYLRQMSALGKDPGWLSAHCRLTVGLLSANCRLTFG